MVTVNATPAVRRLGIVLRVFCALPLVTGLLDMFVGIAPLTALGASIPATVASDPTLGSQVGFWGGIWLGYAGSLWWAAGDVVQRAVPVRLAAATLFLAGVGRAYAAARFGWPHPGFAGAMILELVGAPLIWWWLDRIVSRSSRGTAEH